MGVTTSLVRRHALCCRLVIVVAAALTVAAWTLPELSAAQCAMCITSLKSPEARALADAFRRAIVFLLAVPLATFGVVAFVVVRGQRQADALGQTE